MFLPVFYIRCRRHNLSLQHTYHPTVTPLDARHPIHIYPTDGAKKMIRSLSASDLHHSSSPPPHHDYELSLDSFSAINWRRREPRRRRQAPRTCINYQERSVGRFFRRGRLSLGRHRYLESRLASDDMVFLDRLHVRHTFFVLRGRYKILANMKPPNDNPGTSSRSQPPSSGVLFKPETLHRCAASGFAFFFSDACGVVC